MEYKIAIVNSSSFATRFPSQMKRLETIGSVNRINVSGTMHGKELAEALKDYNIIISSVTPFFDAEFFEHKKDVLIISRHGIGYNNVDIQAAKKANTHVTIVSPLVERDAVAENAVANLMAIMRQVTRSSKAASEDRWVDRAQFVGHNITGKTVGVIGCGNIGSRVAEILKFGFNTRVLVCDPNVDKEWVKKFDMEVCDLDTLVRNADILSLNAALNETSFHILSDECFDKMKKGVYITNTARGDLLDEEAVCRALDKGILAGLAVDVMHEEPASNTHPYFAYENVIVTPHTSAYTIECLEGMGEKCVSDVEHAVKGEPLECLVSR
ncbi:D-isomer specific 2-hydroxyacid dehydrogenase family protein [Amedibacillus sp. YH-ame10]